MGKYFNVGLSQNQATMKCHPMHAERENTIFIVTNKALISPDLVRWGLRPLIVPSCDESVSQPATHQQLSIHITHIL